MRKKTEEQRKLGGTFRPDRTGTAVNLDIPKPACPGWLDEVGRATWERVTATLSGANMAFDVELLATFCDCYSHLIRCSEKLRVEGYSIISESGLPKINPTATALREIQRTLIECAKSLGLSVDSRFKVGIELKNEAVDDEFDEFLKTGRANNERGKK